MSPGEEGGEGERVPYAYTVIRVVPRVEREEFVNVGVVLFSRPRKYLGVRMHLDPARFDGHDGPGCGLSVAVEQFDRGTRAQSKYPHHVMGRGSIEVDDGVGCEAGCREQSGRQESAAGGRRRMGRRV